MNDCNMLSLTFLTFKLQRYGWATNVHFILKSCLVKKKAEIQQSRVDLSVVQETIINVSETSQYVPS